MLDALRDRLRRARRDAGDAAWSVQWDAVRAAATPWMRREFEAARERVRAFVTAGTVIDRDALDRCVRDATPPGVPCDFVVLPGSAIRGRFPDVPVERRSHHLVGRFRLTPRSIPSEAVLVMILYSDVAADYYVETMSADVATMLNEACGARIALADVRDDVPVVLKELAATAGLGTIGKNALFFSNRFGFSCKISAVFLGAPVSRYDEPPPPGAPWKLADCASCNLCVEACPVGAFDDYVITKVASCDRVIAGDFFGPRRDHMCRACITRCPPSNTLLKLARREGAPVRTFWDNEAQLSLAADLFMTKPSFWIWVLQRFYYGAPLPGRDPVAKRSVADTFTAAINVTTSDKTRDGWRLAARKKPR